VGILGPPVPAVHSYASTSRHLAFSLPTAELQPPPRAVNNTYGSRSREAYILEEVWSLLGTWAQSEGPEKSPAPFTSQNTTAISAILMSLDCFFKVVRILAASSLGGVGKGRGRLSPC
jgi:hypothetical protein